MKTLVCVICQTRAVAAWPSLKSHVLDVLGADLALCIAEQDPTPFHESAKYIWQVPEPENWDELFDATAKEHGAATDWRSALEFLNGAMGPIGRQLGSGAILFFFRQLLYKKLIESGAIDQYDRFIITRSDFMYLIDHPSLELMKPEFLWVPDGEKYGGITDRYAIVSRNDLPAYLDMLSDIFRYPQDFIAWTKKNEWVTSNPESLIFNHLKTHNVASRVRFFPYFMYSIKTALDKTRWSQGKQIDGLDHLVKYTGEYDAAQTTMTILRSKDWSQMISE